MGGRDCPAAPRVGCEHKQRRLLQSALGDLQSLRAGVLATGLTDPGDCLLYPLFIPTLVEQTTTHTEIGQVVFRCVSRVNNKL